MGLSCALFLENSEKNIGFWKYYNFLPSYFCEHANNSILWEGFDLDPNGEDFYIDRDVLMNLKHICKNIIENFFIDTLDITGCPLLVDVDGVAWGEWTEIAETFLPPANIGNGGSTKIDEFYLQKLLSLVEDLTEILNKYPDEETFVFTFCF